MFVFLCKRVALNQSSITLLDSNTQLVAFRFKALFLIRCLSSTQISQTSNKEHSFAVSYLINAFGFSPRAALSASKRLKFETPEKPDCNVSFLRDNGFSDTQISIVVRRMPQLLMADLNKTLLPKIEFLQSIGVSGEVLPKVITGNPKFLTLSLKQHIIPCYDVLKSVLSDDKVIKAIRRLGPFNLSLAKNYLAVNISILRELGVPESTISFLLYTSPNALCRKADKFDGAVKKIMGMGFDPAKSNFAHALQAQLQLSPKTLGAKVDVFRRWGLSEDQFLSAFRKDPNWLKLSEKTIMKKMNFLVNTMGWQPDFVARYPNVLAFNLERRIVPRCLVIRILLLKGLIKTDISLLSIVVSSEKYFLNTYVNRYVEKVPELLDVLQGKIGMTELGFERNEKKGEAFCK